MSSRGPSPSPWVLLFHWPECKYYRIGVGSRARRACGVPLRGRVYVRCTPHAFLLTSSTGGLLSELIKPNHPPQCVFQRQQVPSRMYLASTSRSTGKPQQPRCRFRSCRHEDLHRVHQTRTNRLRASQDRPSGSVDRPHTSRLISSPKPRVPGRFLVRQSYSAYWLPGRRTAYTSPFKRSDRV